MKQHRAFIFEGDPSIPDVQRRYGNQVPGVAGSLLRPDEAESAIIDLGTLLEQALSAKNAPTHVIVNLPGGAASTVDPLAADLRASEKINYPKSGADYGPRMF